MEKLRRVPEMQFPEWISYIFLINALAILQQHRCKVSAIQMAVGSNSFFHIPSASSTNVSNDFEWILEHQLKQQRQETVGGLKSLSRKRRYLEFPMGSSFQLVAFDSIAVLGYANYLTVGVTIALAWELPSQPPSELLENLQDTINDGSFITNRNDTVTNVVYEDATQKSSGQNNFGAKSYREVSQGHGYYNTKKALQPSFQVPIHKQYYYRPPYGYSRLAVKGVSIPTLDWWNKHNYYNTERSNAFVKWPPWAYYGEYAPQLSSAKNPWWNLASRLSNSLPSKMSSASNKRTKISKSQPQHQRKPNRQGQQQQRQSNSAYRQSTPERKHRIYPVFGKRSISGFSYNSKHMVTDSQRHLHHQQQQRPHRQRRSGIFGTEPSRLDRIHIRHQRSSRQKLYGRIEKYLDKHGLNGHHCVLRALCETGQKATEQEPTSFVSELMRAVFTLPEPLEEDLLDNRVLFKEHRYDAAHALRGDCVKRYALCKKSLWELEYLA